jgi:hypothetical protein
MTTSMEDEMTPMEIFEGARSNVERGGRAERRLTDLAQAVRQHEDTTRGQIARSARPQHRHLYERLRQIFGEA